MGIDRNLQQRALAVDLFEACAAAKRLYVERLTSGQLEPLSKADETFKKVSEITGDPLPYGIEPNRLVLESIVRYSVEQGILKKPVGVDEIFAAGTHGLKG